MPPVGFELTVSAGERPQTYALDPRGHLDRRFGGLALEYDEVTALI